MDALKAFIKPENIKVFEKYNVLSRRELEARYEVYLERYAKTINIEGLTSVHIVKRQIIPAVSQFLVDQIATLGSVESVGLKNSALETQVKTLNSLLLDTFKKTESLGKAIEKAQAAHGNAEQQASLYRDKVFTAQAELRKTVDELEAMVGSEYWPMPTYSEMLFLL